MTRSPQPRSVPAVLAEDGAGAAAATQAAQAAVVNNDDPPPQAPVTRAMQVTVPSPSGELKSFLTGLRTGEPRNSGASAAAFAVAADHADSFVGGERPGAGSQR